MKRSLFGFSVLLVAALATGCGSGDQNGTNSGGTGGTGASNTGGTGGNTGGTGGSTGGGNTGGTATGGGNTGGTGGGGVCGGLAGVTCGAGEFCDFPENMCGGDDGQGTCVAKPDACDSSLAPVCACDGTVYSNECVAQQAGQDLQLLGGCAAPADQFPCGAGFCQKGADYCQIQISDIGGEPNSYSCVALPPNCKVADATCACLSDVACGNNCELTEGSFTLTCPGG